MTSGYNIKARDIEWNRAMAAGGVQSVIVREAEWSRWLQEAADGNKNSARVVLIVAHNLKEIPADAVCNVCQAELPAARKPSAIMIFMRKEDVPMIGGVCDECIRRFPDDQELFSEAFKSMHARWPQLQIAPEVREEFTACLIGEALERNIIKAPDETPEEFCARALAEMTSKEGKS